MLVITMFLAGISAVFFIISGVRWASMQKFLNRASSLRRKKEEIRSERVSTVYWLSATAVYLGWSFWTNAWENTWIVWSLAGVLFTMVMCICNLLIDREK